ncbi:MAG: glycosyltransferase family 2 protein, partial [Gammaproteobacteria bacterium]|nr:glycosyltransferase family 2 protein [Gammaproteobacteria bacterium]
VEFEIIVVNDGSTDSTKQLLEDYAQHYRQVKVFEQENAGLTRSLIRACANAKGRYIARQDCGDSSLPERLLKQFELLESEPELLMVSCATRFIDEKGTYLYSISQTSEELNVDLLGSNESSLRAPSHHGSVMFRRDAYEKVGGYRLPFYVAQDLDLWSRFIEIGSCASIREELYETQWNPGSIRHLKRKQQLIATRAILQSRKSRMEGKTETGILKALDRSLNRKKLSLVPLALQASRYHYFIGSILANRDSEAAIDHYSVGH